MTDLNKRINRLERHIKMLESRLNSTPQRRVNRKPNHTLHENFDDLKNRLYDEGEYGDEALNDELSATFAPKVEAILNDEGYDVFWGANAGHAGVDHEIVGLGGVTYYLGEEDFQNIMRDSIAATDSEDEAVREMVDNITDNYLN